MYKVYDFSKREDIEYFDAEINTLAHVRKFGMNGISLVKCYDLYSGSDPRVIQMAIDLKLTLFHLFTMIRNLNHNMHRDDTETLFAFHGNWVSFIALYRSFFDKFMNIVVYTCFKDRYKDFDGANSKNKSFKKILIENPTIYTPSGVFMNLPNGFASWAHEYLNQINQQYRTAEIHGDGRARKWAFQEPDLNQTPISLIQDFINHLGQFLHIGCFILVGTDYGKELENGIYEEKL